jgi:hypothetical protein
MYNMNKKINGIVFSRDRAAQLSLFLDSVNKNAAGVFDLNVILSHTDEEYDQAYGMVVNNPAYKDINFIEAGNNFKDQVLGLMKTDHDYFSFFLDDDIIYNKVNFEDVTSKIEDDGDVICFSLRLGENTTKCYTLGADNVMIDMDMDDYFMKWDWNLHYLDFGYPFAMDGHVFRRKDIYKLARKSTFTNVEELEMALFEYTDSFPRNKMVSYRESRLVNAPAGRVQQSIEDEMTLALKNSEARIRRKKINTLFIEENFINLETIDFSNIEGCHQKIDFGIIDSEIKSSGLDKVAIRQYGKRWDELTKEEQSEINKSIDKLESMAKQK